MKSNVEWVEVNPGVWKPVKAGESIEGVLINKEDAAGVDKKSHLYHLEVLGQGPVAVWGSAVLDERMKLVPVGKLVRIVFEGKGKNSKGQALNLYKVYFQ